VNGSLHTIEGRSVLRFERRLAHPPEKVWRAITEAEELAGWFPAEMQGERKAGAPIRFVFGNDEAPPQDGEITEFDRPRLFAYTWSDSVLRWELRPDPAGCLLVFTHTFDERPSAASLATGWDTCLDGLDRVLSGRTEPVALGGKLAATRRYRTRHEAYAEVFGLLAGTAQPSGQGWLVRFERQFPYPAEEVWAALTGGTEPAAGDPPPQPATAGHAPAGPVTEAEPGALLGYGSATGAVRWRLSPGPGGTLVELTQRTGDDAARVEALAGWHARLEWLAAELAGRIDSTPPEELHARYAAQVDHS
jgi:uncharacterized protein YndB with AHSA1/START domain